QGGCSPLVCSLGGKVCNLTPPVLAMWLGTGGSRHGLKTGRRHGQRSRRCCADAFLEGGAIRDGLLRPATPIDRALAGSARRLEAPPTATRLFHALRENLSSALTCKDWCESGPPRPRGGNEDLRHKRSLNAVAARTRLGSAPRGSI